MKDTGIGMDPDYLPRIFDAFSQEDAGNTSRFGGSGLGLSITSSFVRLCGGEIHVESEKGVGTTFRVQLPYKLGSEADLPVNFIRQTEEAKTPQGAPGKKEGSERIKGTKENKGLQGIEENKEIDSPSESFSEMTSISGMHVLIAEDQEMNAEILMELLELEDVNAEWAADGQQAVKMFEKSEVRHFDVILMDMRMPVMDGLTATRTIRNLDRPDAKIVPIIALSANAFEEDVQQCLASGMNMHLAKPVEFALLKEALVKMRKKDR
jgi:CheY-like chemotaxis protein